MCMSMCMWVSGHLYFIVPRDRGSRYTLACRVLTAASGPSAINGKIPALPLAALLAGLPTGVIKYPQCSCGDISEPEECARWPCIPGPNFRRRTICIKISYCAYRRNRIFPHLGRFQAKNESGKRCGNLNKLAWK